MFFYIFNMLSKFQAHDHIKINCEVEQNYSDNFSIDFVVEVKKIYMLINIYFFCLKFMSKSMKFMLNHFLTQYVATVEPTTK